MKKIILVCSVICFLAMNTEAQTQRNLQYPSVSI